MSNPKTDKQRSAIHVWFRQCAAICREHGYTLDMFIHDLEKSGIEVPVTEAIFKEMYRVAYTATTGNESTEDATTTGFDPAYHAMVKFFAERGIQLPPWPDNRRGWTV